MRCICLLQHICNEMTTHVGRTAVFDYENNVAALEARAVSDDVARRQLNG